MSQLVPDRKRMPLHPLTAPVHQARPRLDADDGAWFVRVLPVTAGVTIAASADAGA